MTEALAREKLIQIRNAITEYTQDILSDSLLELVEESYDIGYEDGIGEGVRIEKVQAKGIDPWSDEGEKLRAQLLEQELKEARAARRAAKKAEKEKLTIAPKESSQEAKKMEEKESV